jgi:hypothetical protein
LRTIGCKKWRWGWGYRERCSLGRMLLPPDFDAALAENRTTAGAAKVVNHWSHADDALEPGSPC